MIPISARTENRAQLLRNCVLYMRSFKRRFLLLDDFFTLGKMPFDACVYTAALQVARVDGFNLYATSTY